jgi:hypothetical protein
MAQDRDQLEVCTVSHVLFSLRSQIREKWFPSVISVKISAHTCHVLCCMLKVKHVSTHLNN